MERRAVAVIASRVVAAYLLCCALYEATYLPVRVYEVWHHLANVMYPSAATQGYWLNYYILNLGFGVIRTIAWLMLAGFLYRFGPRVRSSFCRELRNWMSQLISPDPRPNFLAPCLDTPAQIRKLGFCAD